MLAEAANLGDALVRIPVRRSPAAVPLHLPQRLD
jgi:hypothetical protein